MELFFTITILSLFVIITTYFLDRSDMAQIDLEIKEHSTFVKEALDTPLVKKMENLIHDLDIRNIHTTREPCSNHNAYKFNVGNHNFTFSRSVLLVNDNDLLFNMKNSFFVRNFSRTTSTHQIIVKHLFDRIKEKSLNPEMKKNTQVVNEIMSL
jgi:hypothetical protein